LEVVEKDCMVKKRNLLKEKQVLPRSWKRGAENGEKLGAAKTSPVVQISF